MFTLALAYVAALSARRRDRYPARQWTVADEREMAGERCQAAWTGMPRRLSRSQSPILDPRAPPALPSRQHALSTLNGMSAAQLVFAIIGACVAAAGLVWTVTWAVRSWRKSGPEVVAEVGQGQVVDRGILRVLFRSGDLKICRLNVSWDWRENVYK